jgi:hypothetical protein
VASSAISSVEVTVVDSLVAFETVEVFLNAYFFCAVYVV